MKKNLKTIILSGFLSVLVIAGLMFSNKATAQGVQESASGHGTLLVSNEDGDIVRRQFSFNAKRHSDGTVTGQAVLHNPAFEGANGNKYQAKFDISCMQIVGNIAVLGGFVRRTNDPNLVDAAYFSVEDNGEPGKNNDRISSVFFFDDDPNTTGDPQGCLEIGPTDLPLNTIEAGNIQVRP